MPHEIEAVIFDLDGTLIDTYKEYRRKLKRVCKAGGVPWTPELSKEALAYWGKPIKLFFEEVLCEEPPEARYAMHILFQRLEIKRQPKLISGALETLVTLEEWGKVRLLLTNRDGPTTRVYLRLLQVIDRFQHLAYGDFFQKPDTRIADGTIEVLATRGISLERTILVGDSHDDRLLGRALGIRTVLVGTSTLSEMVLSDHPRGDFLPSIAELPAWLAAQTA